MLLSCAAAHSLWLGAQSPSAKSSFTQDRPTFDAASIKLNKSGDGAMMVRPEPGGRFTGVNVTLETLANLAYQLKDHQLVGGPGWIHSEHFDIEAKAGGNSSMEQMRPMLQSILANRFKLVVHHELRQFPIYALVLSKAGKTGPQVVLHSDDTKCADYSAGPPSPPKPAEGPPQPPCGGFSGGIGRLLGQKVTMDIFARALSNYVDRIVVNQTGLSGAFDLNMEFMPLQSPLGAQTGPDTSVSDSSELPYIFTAVQEQLGLKLLPQTGPIDVLVIDHVEEPSPN